MQDEGERDGGPVLVVAGGTLAGALCVGLLGTEPPATVVVALLLATRAGPVRPSGDAAARRRLTAAGPHVIGWANSGRFR